MPTLTSHELPGEQVIDYRSYLQKYGRRNRLKGVQRKDYVRVQAENAWTRKLTEVAHPVKIMYGGRGGGKSWGIARALLRMMDWGEKNRFGTPLRVAILRDTFESIDESVRYNIKQQINFLRLAHKFEITYRKITHENGSEIFFSGLSDLTADRIRSLESVDIAWYDEAQQMSEYAWITLQPTIRKQGSEIWLSFNPRNIFDPVWKLTENPEPSWMIQKVGWQNNRFFTEANEQQRLRDQRVNPHLYNWIWEGQPNSAAEGLRVLPYDLVSLCVDAWDLRPKGDYGMIESGLDVADGGADFYGFVQRRGPCILDAEERQFATQGDAVRYYHSVLKDKPVKSLRFDRTGVGAGVNSEYASLGARTYQVIAEDFGGAVKGKKTQLLAGTRNGDFFGKRNAQMAWALRIRADRTQRLVHGEDIDPNKCLFINPGIRCLDELKRQLSQPLYIHEDGKMRIYKKGQMQQNGTIKPKALRSPNLFDGASLAFGGDSIFGLIA